MQPNLDYAFFEHPLFGFESLAEVPIQHPPEQFFLKLTS